MEDIGNDNFDNILQLSKILTSESRSSRQETDRIELLLKRVAKQSAISYEGLSTDIPQETADAYDTLSRPSEAEKLIRENYNLLYHIEQQEYIEKKVHALIKNINQHIFSIKNVLIDQRISREQDLENFMYENIEAKGKIIQASIEKLSKKNELISDKLNSIIVAFRDVYTHINWSLIPQNTNEYIKFSEKIAYIESTYDIQLTKG